MLAAERAAFTAVCPTCTMDAEWSAEVRPRDDLSRTEVRYRIDCSWCDGQPDAGPSAVLDLRPVSRLGWLGRTA